MSLQDQLTQIHQNSRAVALDRYRKEKLHSISFLYDRTYAATQDYESIFSESLVALDKLEILDSRFSKFRDTIFSEFSLRIDREAQTKEQEENLGKTIDAFLSMLSPYWHLAISVKAAEWPLRRFSMNIYNSEYLLLCSLPYYDQPIFERMLYVIPVLPPMFQWLQGFKKSGKCPTNSTIKRAFCDETFLNLYSKFLIKEVSHSNVYRQELIFFTSMLIMAIASLSASNSKELSNVIALSLEASSALMDSTGNESKISAYTILAVISSAVPLSRDVIVASIDTILTTLNGKLTASALKCILKLYQTIQTDSLDALPLSVFNKLPDSLLKDYQDIIFSTGMNGSFLTAYIRAALKAQSIIIEVVDVLDSVQNFNITTKAFSLIEEDALSIVKNDAHNSENYVPLFRYLLDRDEAQFRKIVNKAHLTVSDLELLLHATILDRNAEDETFVDAEEDNEVESFDSVSGNITEGKPEGYQSLVSDTVSFLSSDKQTAQTFFQLRDIYFKSIQTYSFETFLQQGLKDEDQRISFLLRVASEEGAPIRARTLALSMVKKCINSIGDTILTYSIIPVVCTFLLDTNARLRCSAVEIIDCMSSKKSNNAQNFCLPYIYDGTKTKKVAMLSPKDGYLLLQALQKEEDVFKIDSGSFLSSFGTILGSKKLGQVFLAFFAAHGLENGIPDIKRKLMRITAAGCNAVKKASGPVEVFGSFISNYIASRAEWIERCGYTNCGFNSFEDDVLNLISVKDFNQNALLFLEQALTSPYKHLSVAAQSKMLQVFSTIPFDCQMHLINCVLENGLNDKNTTFYDPADLLEEMNLNSKLLVELFKGSVLSNSAQPQTNIPKRRRASSASARHAMREMGVSSLARQHLQKLTVLLDVLYHFSTLKNFNPSVQLLEPLFTILDDLETLGIDGKLPVLYAQETLASCMVNLIHKISDNHIHVDDISSIRADIVVSSIRSSDSPQVQNKLLLVVAALASFVPEIVLHSVMPIFTFMGAHTIRQDDEFSSQVVEETIRCVVPALASTAKSGMDEEIDFLLTSFVSAFPHIPRHRRVKLFTTLATTLGSHLSMHLILFLCGQQYAAAYSKHSMDSCTALVDFSSTFLQRFNSAEQIDAARKYLDLWKMIPEDPVEKDSKMYSNLTTRVVFSPSILLMNKSELYNLRRGLVSYLRHSLVDFKGSNGYSRLRIVIASEFLHEENVDRNLKVFSALIGDLLSLVDEYSGNVEDEEIIKKLYKLLANILSFLPLKYYVDSASRILKSASSSVRTIRHLTTLTGTKFEFEEIDDPHAREGIEEIVPILLHLIESNADLEISQSSFDTIASLLRRFGEKLDTSLFKSVMNVAIGKFGLLSMHSPELVVSSINCLTSIVLIEGVKIIGYFPKFVPPIYQIFESLVKSSDEDTSRLGETAILVLFATLIRKIPNFLIPEVENFESVVFRSNLASLQVRSSVLMSIVDSADSKAVLSAMCNLWNGVSSLDASTIGLFLSALEATINKLERKVAISESTVFTRFFLDALEFKSKTNFDINTANRIESTIDKCGIDYVLKLNDKSFRPLFASIVRWAFDEEKGEVHDRSLRLQSFFKFFNKLQEQLQSIITTYYSYLLDSVEQLLRDFSESRLEDIPLRRLVLISLATSFKYDQIGFWQSSTRFDAVSIALCSQLSNVEDKIGKHLIKAITTLVKVAGSDEHNKAVNTLLMSHMKTECKPREKYWTVRVLKSIYKKVGENWLSLLPQLVPLIAELLEDDDESVEAEVRTGLAKVIEQVMGEPLDRYLE